MTEHTPSPQSVVVPVSAWERFLYRSDFLRGAAVVDGHDVSLRSFASLVEELKAAAVPAPSSLAGGEGSQNKHDYDALTCIAAHLRDNPAHPFSGRQCEEFVQSARDAQFAALSPEAPAREGEELDDDDASTYEPSIAGLSDYLWNQALGAESVESRCILEMWREAVDALPPRHEAPAELLSNPQELEAPAEGAGERVYIDCEFDGHNGPLLSVALVRESGDSIHIRADVEPMDLWVRQNVLPLMDSHKAARSEKVYAYEVGGVIRSFLGEGSPVIVCDSPQDARYFSQALTTAPDGGYAPFPFDGLTIEVLGVDAYPTTLEGAVQHNAWWDAMALREALRVRSSAPEASEVKS